MATTKFNISLAFMAVAFGTCHTSAANECNLVAQHYNTTAESMAEELEAARMAAESDMDLEG